MGLSESFGERIKRARGERNLSQSGLADALSVSRTTIAEWEAGRSSPEFSRLEPLAEALGRPVSWFFLQDQPDSFAEVSSHDLFEAYMEAAEACAAHERHLHQALHGLRSARCYFSFAAAHAATRDDGDSDLYELHRRTGFQYEPADEFTGEKLAENRWRQFTWLTGVSESVERSDDLESLALAGPDSEQLEARHLTRLLATCQVDLKDLPEHQVQEAEKSIRVWRAALKGEGLDVLQKEAKQ